MCKNFTNIMDEDEQRHFLHDIEMFLAITLRDESLTDEGSEHKSRLLKKIEKARRDYPQLQMKESYRVKEQFRILSPPPRPQNGPTKNMNNNNNNSDNNDGNNKSNLSRGGMHVLGLAARKMQQVVRLQMPSRPPPPLSISRISSPIISSPTSQTVILVKQTSTTSISSSPPQSPVPRSPPPLPVSPPPVERLSLPPRRPPPPTSTHMSLRQSPSVISQPPETTPPPIPSSPPPSDSPPSSPLLPTRSNEAISTEEYSLAEGDGSSESNSVGMHRIEEGDQEDSGEVVEEEEEDIYEIIEPKDEHAETVEIDTRSINSSTSSKVQHSADTISVTSSSYQTLNVSLPCDEAIPLSTMAGYLEKRKDTKVVLRKYSRRYCLLYNDIFLVYSKIADVSPREQYLLSRYDVRETSIYTSTSTSVKYREICFDLVCPGEKTVTFMAASKQEQESWVRKIKEVKLQMCNKPKVDSFRDNDEIPDYDDTEGVLAFMNNQRQSDLQMYTETDSVCDVQKNKSSFEGKIKFPSTEGVTTSNQLVGGGSSSSSGHGSDESEGEEIDYENWYIGKWACKADSEDELEFKRGELIHIISREYDNYGWWIGKINGNGRIGLIPKNYLMEAYELIC